MNSSSLTISHDLILSNISGASGLKFGSPKCHSRLLIPGKGTGGLCIKRSTNLVYFDAALATKILYS